MTVSFHLYYFKVFFLLTFFSSEPQRAVSCLSETILSVQFRSFQFSLIQFNTVCFTWKWLTLLTVDSHSLCKCSQTVCVCERETCQHQLHLFHSPWLDVPSSASPTGTERNRVIVCE